MKRNNSFADANEHILTDFLVKTEFELLGLVLELEALRPPPAKTGPDAVLFAELTLFGDGVQDEPVHEAVDGLPFVSGHALQQEVILRQDLRADDHIAPGLRWLLILGLRFVPALWLGLCSGDGVFTLSHCACVFSGSFCGLLPVEKLKDEIHRVALLDGDVEHMEDVESAFGHVGHG